MNFMSQNGVKPGFLEESKDTPPCVFEPTAMTLDTGMSETSSPSQPQDEAADGPPKGCVDDEITSHKSSKYGEFEKKVKRRWGKAEDKILWQTIREDISNGRYTLEVLKNIPLVEGKRNIHVQQLSQRIGWKTTNVKLLERIQKSISDSFSAREEILLRKLIKKKGYKNLDYDTILSHFPGKSRERIVEVCQNFCDAKKMKKLTNAKII